jgi:methionyl-tRNA synthetase
VGSVLPADVYYKYLRMRGDDAIFICGSDQHGTPIELAAVKKGVEPRVLADEMHHAVKSLFEKYECTFTHYGKTHTDENKEVVYDVFNELFNNGYILEKEDMQAYCNIDKRFLPDRFIQGICPYCHKRSARGDQCDNCGRLLEPAQVLDPFCAICGKSDIDFRKVKSLALELDKLQNEVKEFVKNKQKHNWSKDSVNKTLSMIKEGLKPRDITRNMRWGFQVPLAGYEDAVFYVWFDAVLGYIGITKEWDEKKWRDYWQNEHTQLVQFLGKDNTVFHTIMWPAMLIGSRLGFVLPYTIKESQFLVSKTVKFSKSHGIGLNMKTALEIIGPDYWRFALMSMYPENADSEFTEKGLAEVVNTVMNDKIGNLAQRVLKLSKSNSFLVEGKIPVGGSPNVKKATKEYRDAFDKLQLKKAIGSVVRLADIGNGIMSGKEPWVLAKKAKDDERIEKQAKKIFSELLAITYAIGVLLYPFAPKASAALLSSFGVKTEPALKMLEDEVRPDLENEPKPIFQKMTNSEIEKLKKYA